MTTRIGTVPAYSGEFDYEAYINRQAHENKRKLEWTWVLEEWIHTLGRYVRARKPSGPWQGLCHGTRRGNEQRWFRDALPGGDVIGTEIADSAVTFPHTLHWDFHDAKPEWLGQMDFVYSNSLDHAYAPERAVMAWVACLNQTGVVLIDWVDLPLFESVRSASDADCFVTSAAHLRELVEKVGVVRDVLKHKPVRNDKGPRVTLVVTKE